MGMDKIIPDSFLRKCAIILIIYQVFEVSLYALFYNHCPFPDFLYLFPEWAPTIISIFLFGISFTFFRKYKNYGFLCLGVMQIFTSCIRLVSYLYKSLIKTTEIQGNLLGSGRNFSEFAECRSIVYHIYILQLLLIIALAHFSIKFKKDSQSTSTSQ